MLIFSEMICMSLVYFFDKYDFFMYKIKERIFIDFYCLTLYCKMDAQFNKSHFAQ